MNDHRIAKPSKLMWALFKAQKGLCFWCEKRMFMIFAPGQPKGSGATREHVFPHASTGRGMMNNIVISHAACNCARKDKPPSAAEIGRAARIYIAIGREPFLPRKQWEAKYGPLANRRGHIAESMEAVEE